MAVKTAEYGQVFELTNAANLSSSVSTSSEAETTNKDIQSPGGWNDKPITEYSQDSFDRVDYAGHVARLIERTHAKDDSVVLGLAGPWGSGKSSLLALISNALKEKNKSKESSGWKVAHFTPWATSDFSSLLEEFYASLSSALEAKKDTKIWSQLKKLAAISKPTIEAIPGVGKVVTDTFEIVSEIVSKSDEDPVPWNVAFKEIACDLKEQEHKVLIMVDDIDRLQTDEVLGLFKILRLLGRFPGVSYLLAYDEVTLHHTLSAANLIDKTGIGTANKFMEKIVQYPLVMPPLTSQQIISAVELGLDEVFREIERPLTEKGRLTALTDVIFSQLATPRSIGRFLAQMRHQLSIFDSNEVNHLDLTILTLLRVAFPALYADLPNWREELIGSRQDSDILYEKRVNNRLLLDTVPKTSRGYAGELLIALFPGIHPNPRSRRKFDAQSIADEEYFDRYFVMGIPAHDISDVEVSQAVTSAARGDDEQLKQFILEHEPERAARFIKKGHAYSTKKWDDAWYDAYRIELVGLLLAIVDDVPYVRNIIMNPGPLLDRWIVGLLRGISAEASVDKVIASLKRAPNLAIQAEVLDDWTYNDVQEMNLLSDLGDEQFEQFATGLREAVIEDRCIEATREIINHIMRGDEASYEDEVLPLIFFVRGYSHDAELRQEIKDLLNDSQVDVEDVAARFVRVDVQPDRDPQQPLMLGFEQTLFEWIVPHVPCPGHNSVLAENLDITDVSWANRKLFATQYVMHSRD